MQGSKWFNRGTLLGLCVGVVFGAAITLTWYLLRLPPTTQPIVEAPKTQPEPSPSAMRRLTEAELADLADQIQKLEQLAESLRVEIEIGEKQIEKLARANGTTGGEDNAKRIAVLQIRHVESESECNRVGRELLRLEVELTFLKKQLADAATTEPNPIFVREWLEKDPRVAKAKELLAEKQSDLTRELSRPYLNDYPTFIELGAQVAKAKQAYDEAVKIAKPEAIEAARKLDTTNTKERIAKLESTIAAKKEEREKLKEERDALKKLIDVGVGGGLNIQAMRDALKPQKETLDKVNVELTKLRLKQKFNQ